MTEITRMQTIFLVLKHPKNMNMEFLSIPEVAAWKRSDFITNWGEPFAHCSEMTVSTRDRLHNSFFFKSTHPLSHWLCIVHQQWWEDMKNKVIPTQHSADWDIAPPLRNVRVDTQYVGIIEEQKQQIKQLQVELAEFNCVWYRTLPANASRGKNVLRTSKKMSMIATNHKSASSCF
jgi:hypothetical protein